jgi:hypothetical protein
MNGGGGRLGVQERSNAVKGVRGDSLGWREIMNFVFIFKKN